MDKAVHDALREGNHEDKLAALRQAANFYGVARKLRKEFDEEIGLPRLEPVLRVLEALQYEVVVENQPVDLVNKVREEISQKYGGWDTLSLTTKFLWLKYRDPVVIYDNSVRMALDVEAGDYQQYLHGWRRQYHQKERLISEVCKRLPSVHRYAARTDFASPEYIREVGEEPWFQRRVFDTYLRHVGTERT
jgi:hypothetical protein